MLTKRFGWRRAVEHLTFDALPGRVTGLLGPPGAGKSVVLRVVMGRMAPDSGVALVNGRLFEDLRAPASEIGGLLFPGAFHPSATVGSHLGAHARAAGLGSERPEAVLHSCGLATVADRRASALAPSLAHRLGIATALLGDPETLVIDEAPPGIDGATRTWARGLVRAFAREGRTVLVAGRDIEEMSRMTDHAVVLAGGLRLAELSMAALRAVAPGSIRVRSAAPSRLIAAVEAAGMTADAQADHSVVVTGCGLADVEGIAARAGIRLQELAPAG